MQIAWGWICGEEEGRKDYGVGEAGQEGSDDPTHNWCSSPD